MSGDGLNISVRKIRFLSGQGHDVSVSGLDRICVFEIKNHLWMLRVSVYVGCD
jgi:hypothetical protein